MKRKMLIIFHLFFIFGLYAERVIPFFYDEIGCIYVTAYSDENDEFKFWFDTAETRSAVFTEGIEKYMGQNLDEFLFDRLKENNLNAKDEDLRNYIPTLKNKSILNFRLKTLNIDDFYFGDKILMYDYSSYKNLEADGFDGVLDLRFFDVNKNITIDYTNNQIRIDDDEINAESIPMYKMKKFNIYYIDIKINGVKQFGIIDTGGPYFLLRPDYKMNKLYEEDELFNMSEESLNSMFMKEDKEKSVRLKIGDFSEKVTGHFFTLEKYKIQSGAGTKAVIAAYNILGNEVFKNHIIQMDFENMEFRIK